MIPSALAATMLLTACAKESSDRVIVVTPDVVDYAPDVQALAMEEYSRLGPPCLRNEVFEGCSALKTFVNDYKLMRDQARAAGK